MGSPTPVLTWKELAAAAAEQGRLEELRAAEIFKADAPTFPFGAHVAAVEVDTETGEVELRRLVAVDDAGTLVNPVIAEGQVHGGVAAGVAQALFEEFVYDEEGNPLRRRSWATRSRPRPSCRRGTSSRWRRRRR